MPVGGGEGRRFQDGDRRADFHGATFLISFLIRRKNDFVQGRPHPLWRSSPGFPALQAVSFEGHPLKDDEAFISRLPRKGPLQFYFIV